MASVPLALGGAVVAASASPTRQPAARFAAYPSKYVDFSGYGFGPGIGMGQWGDFGYAISEHSYRWILAHFYGGTSVASIGNPLIGVAITENAGHPLVVTSPSPFSFGPRHLAGGTVARAMLNRYGKWSIGTATSCGATTWRTVATGLSNPVAFPYSRVSTAPIKDLLTICRADGVHMTVRGAVEAYDDTPASGNKSRTVNWLYMDTYVADVVPAEASSGWGLVGPIGPQRHRWGFQSLEAQAVAARTYAERYLRDGGWFGYATICDWPDCQTYQGITSEAPVSTAAVTYTSGLILVHSGFPAPVQYSASTGGYTATSAEGNQFPAVVDLGDSICLTNTGYWTCNPCHKWNAAAQVSSVQAAIQALYPTFGTLAKIQVSTSNGLGAGGGRAIEVTATDTNAIAVKLPASEIEWLVQSPQSCSSDWFSVTINP